ncbi:MAG: L,D-transpeptidase family protein [Vulcanimicrobiota bacterium]
MPSVKNKNLQFLTVLFLLIANAISVSCADNTINRNYSDKIYLYLSLTTDNNVEIKWKIDEKKFPGLKTLTLFSSYSDFNKTPLDRIVYPIRQYETKSIKHRGAILDDNVGDNSKYYYLLELVTDQGKTYYSKVISIKTVDKKLPELNSPSLIIDKRYYLLKLIDDGNIIKRYPVSLGRNPIKRKLHQDNSSTPEGQYKIINLQPQATYYRAYDLSYPESIDKFRYHFFQERDKLEKSNGENPGIGGEIQIHGGGPGPVWNWSYGCIIMRNEDLDQLFGISRINVGTPVIITGWELTLQDIQSIHRSRSAEEIKTIQKKLKKTGFDPGKPDGVLGPATRYALARFQYQKQLPVTGQLDIRTLKKLSNIQLTK